MPLIGYPTKKEDLRKAVAFEREKLGSKHDRELQRHKAEILFPQQILYSYDESDMLFGPL